MGCQLKRISKLILIILLTFSCAKQSKNYGIKVGQSAWFSTSKDFSYRNEMGDIPFHAFYDALPKNKNYDANEFNAVILTRRDSIFQYEFDLASGAPYLERKFCDHKDAWARYSSRMKELPFNVGFIPRSLDQLARAQKVYIFGEAPEGTVTDGLVYPIRLIGGVVEQFCDNFPCSIRDEWQSRLVFIAVFSSDKEYSSVYDLDSLKRIVDWSRIKAVMENYQGANSNEGKTLPAYRVLNEVSLTKALEFSSNNNHSFTYQSAKALQSSCQALYDYVWENSQALYPANKDSLKKEQAKVNQSKYEIDIPITSKLQGNVLSFEHKVKAPQAKLQKRKIFKTFHSFFQHFYANYRSKYLTCEKFIQSSSVTEDFERHWFFSYLQNYFHLEDLGFVYSCNREAWLENPLLQSGKRVYDNLSEVKKCSTSSLDLAMVRAITVMTSRQRSGRPYYKYIEYDSGAGHSHQKIYRWVFQTGKKLSCESATAQGIFPEDVNWRPFHVQKKLEEQGYIY